MNTQFDMFHTIRYGAFAILLASLLVVIPAASTSAQSEEDVRQAGSEARTVHVGDSGFATDPDCEAAVTEAAGWPNFDPSRLGEQARQVEQAKIDAAEEAAGWPDLDPSSLGDQVRRVEAAGKEAVGWPDLDPSNMPQE